jgi:hypothetical protein
MDSLPKDLLWCIKEKLEDETSFELAIMDITNQTIEIRHFEKACAQDDVYHMAMWVRANNIRQLPTIVNCTVKSADWLYRFIKPVVSRCQYNHFFNILVMGNKLDLLRWLSTKVEYRPGNINDLFSYCLYHHYLNMCRYLLYESCAETCLIQSNDIIRYAYNNYQLHKIVQLIGCLYIDRYHRHLLQDICNAVRGSQTRKYMFETYGLKPTTK